MLIIFVLVYLTWALELLKVHAFQVVELVSNKQLIWLLMTNFGLVEVSITLLLIVKIVTVE
jgi:hypothetical protein